MRTAANTEYENYQYSGLGRQSTLIGLAKITDEGNIELHASVISDGTMRLSISKAPWVICCAYKLKASAFIEKSI